MSAEHVPLDPTPGLAAVPMGLFLQPCKWEKQSPSLTPNREPSRGWWRAPSAGPPPPTMDTGQGGRGPSTAGVAQVGVAGEVESRSRTRGREMGEDCQVSTAEVRLRVCPGR